MSMSLKQSVRPLNVKIIIREKNKDSYQGWEMPQKSDQKCLVIFGADLLWKFIEGVAQLM